MAQLQMVYLILGICLFGIAISLQAISVQTDVMTTERDLLVAELEEIAEHAQNYYRLSERDGGGESSFIGLTATPDGLSKLMVGSSKYGKRIMITRSGNTSCVEITAVGTMRGKDQGSPIRILMTVRPNSKNIDYIN